MNPSYLRPGCALDMFYFGLALFYAICAFDGTSSKIVLKPETMTIRVEEWPARHGWCDSDADCPESKQICNKTTHACVCPRFAFKPLDSNLCRNQVVVDLKVKDNDSWILKNFSEYRKLIAPHLNISPLAVPSISHPSSVRIFVDARFFESSWDSDDLEYFLSRSLGPSQDVRDLDLKTTVLWDVCRHAESNPCDENAICLGSRKGYEVECACKFDFSSSSNDTGSPCIRQRLCINGGTESPGMSVCQCSIFFWGDHCEINKFRVIVTFSLVSIMVVMILRNLRDCLRNFQRLPPKAKRVSAISYDFIENGQIRRRTMYLDNTKCQITGV